MDNFFPSATNEAKWLNNPCRKKDYTRSENLIYKLPFSCCVNFFSVQPFFFFCFLPFASYSSCFACFPIFLWVPSYRVITALPFYLLLKQPLTPQGKANHLFLSCLPHKYLQKTLRIDIRTENAEVILQTFERKGDWGGGNEQEGRARKNYAQFSHSCVRISSCWFPSLLRLPRKVHLKERNFI